MFHVIPPRWCLNLPPSFRHMALALRYRLYILETFSWVQFKSKAFLRYSFLYYSVFFHFSHNVSILLAWHQPLFYHHLFRHICSFVCWFNICLLNLANSVPSSLTVIVCLLFVHFSSFVIENPTSFWL
ncbi:hypothetical protein EV361DRAFT_205116 [Lentinula raphanica]|nr:hypothetical protein EV361DRAFT_205116 [Lentinula raphanica]